MDAEFWHLSEIQILFLSSDIVARVISNAFKSRIDPDGSSWKNITSETKDYYFEEFRKAYHWEDGMEARVKKAWNTKASKRYYDMLSKEGTINVPHPPPILLNWRTK